VEIITDADEARVADLVGRDVAATIGPGHLDMVMAEARHQRQFAEAVDAYIERVVEEVQQYIHDTRIDTTWPSCPNHPNHPMWFRDGWWCADGQPLARLGALSRLLK
jgi:hypothetical protein